MAKQIGVVLDHDYTYEAHGETVRSTVREFRPCKSEAEALDLVDEHKEKHPEIIEYETVEVVRTTKIYRPYSGF